MAIAIPVSVKGMTIRGATIASGDTVEILASANQKPSKDWLKFVVTSRARIFGVHVDAISAAIDL